MDEKSQRSVYWIIGISLVLILGWSTDLNPFKQKNPDWQVIKEKVAAAVYCNDWDYNNEGVIDSGYGPCVKLVNVNYDTTMGDEYCYSADVQIGGYQGQDYESIVNWNLYGKKYYCVGWHEKYVESDVNNPEDWTIEFGSDSPANLVN